MSASRRLQLPAVRYMAKLPNAAPYGDAALNLIECKWHEKRINTACAILCTFTTFPMLTFCFPTYFLKVIFIDYWQWMFT